MKLAEYLTKKQITSERFARQLKVSISTINKYRAGYRIPTIKKAMRIEKITKGRVRVKDWH